MTAFRGYYRHGRAICDGSCGMTDIWGTHDAHVPVVVLAADRPHPAGVQPPLPVLIAACEGVSEPGGVPCTGELQFRWGMSQAACSTCGGYCGISVAAWTRVEPDATVAPPATPATGAPS